MAKNYAMTAIRRSLVEAHSSVTPGQDAKRTQPGDSSEQRKSASKRMTSISDAHNHRGPHDCPHHPSIVVAVPCAGLASKNKRIICNACNHPHNRRDTRSSVRKRGQVSNIHCSGRALCRPRTQRTINEHQFLTHPNSRDARSSVRSSE